jgi:hypothetical protein
MTTPDSTPVSLATAVALAAMVLAGACKPVVQKGDDRPDAAPPCEGVVDDCGVCDGGNADKDCAGTCFGDAAVDDCDVCGGNNADKDCAGTCFGGATVDACGECDEDPDNDCWAGDRGTRIVTDSTEFDLGSGTMFWSTSGGQVAFFYGEGYTTPTVYVADATNQSVCDAAYPGYAGVTTPTAVRAADQQTYTSPPAIKFGSRESACNMRMLVFRQGDRYGILDFRRIDANGSLHLDYWLGAPGVTDFRNAPVD